MPKAERAMWKSCRNRKCLKRDVVTFTSFDECIVCKKSLVLVKNQNRPHLPEAIENDEDFKPESNKKWRRKVGFNDDTWERPGTSWKKEEEEEFTCDPDIEGGCPLVKAPTVQVSAQLFYDWIHLADQVNTEWLAYLKGKAIDGGWEITEMYFPRQSAGGAHVAPIRETQEDLQPGTIGAIHSHVQMEAFFSSTDLKHMNHDIEMVCNAKGDVKAKVRVKLECGKFQRIDAKIKVIHDPKHSQAVVDDLEAKLTKDRAWGPVGGSKFGWN